MCKRMKAKHYVKNQGDLDQCLEINANRYLLPEIDEIQQWCNSEVRLNTLLGLSQAAPRLIIGTAMVIWAAMFVSLL